MPQAPAKPSGVDQLLMPYVPANVKSNGRFIAQEVTSDVYHVAEGLRELSKDIRGELVLDVVEDTVAKKIAFRVLEVQPERTDVVFWCDRLDGRVVPYVQYLISVPFEHRFKAIEKKIAEYEEEQEQNELDELYEYLGGPMLMELDKLGFLDEFGGRGTKYRPRNFGKGG